MKLELRKATENDHKQIWKILQQAIARRKEDGSDQWQNGYPNPEVVTEDIQKEYGFVFTIENEIAAYVALIENYEPDYENITGQWLNNEKFIVFHRMAISEEYLGKGLGNSLFECIEFYARKIGILNIKADTNFDNPIMLKLFRKMTYQYCGEVMVDGSPRKAFQKKL